MFLKVFKYDFCAMAKPLIFAPAIWLLSAISSALVRLSIENTLNKADALITTPLIFSVLLILFFPFVVIILCLRRYYTHFFTDEGYLTFTLPVKRNTHLLSATLSTILVALLSELTVAGAVLIFASILAGTANADVFSAWLTVKSLLLYFVGSEEDLSQLRILTLASSLVNTCSQVAVFHLSLTCGHLLAKKHKILAAIGVWFGIAFVKNFISSLLSIFDFLGKEGKTLPKTVPDTAILSLAIQIGLGAVLFAAAYLVNRHLLQKRFTLS